MEWLKTIYDIGVETYFIVTDFYFIIVRNGEKVFSIKVNKTTSMISLIEFGQIEKK